MSAETNTGKGRLSFGQTSVEKRRNSFLCSFVFVWVMEVARQHLSVLQRAEVWFPAPHPALTSTWTSSSRRSVPLASSGSCTCTWAHPRIETPKNKPLICLVLPKLNNIYMQFSTKCLSQKKALIPLQNPSYSTEDSHNVFFMFLTDRTRVWSILQIEN